MHRHVCYSRSLMTSLLPSLVNGFSLSSRSLRNDVYLDLGPQVQTLYLAFNLDNATWAAKLPAKVKGPIYHLLLRSPYGKCAWARSYATRLLQIQH